MSARTSSPARIAPATPAPALLALRAQVACLRALLDEIDHVAPLSSAGENLSEQVVDELTRLGHRSLEAAIELGRVVASGRCKV